MHGPENAEFEIRKAYNVVLDGMLPYLWQNRDIPGVQPKEAADLYKRAYRSYRDGNRLAAERWARAAKHLSRAFLCEAKIAYLEAHSAELPFLAGVPTETHDLHARAVSTPDLLDSIAGHAPPGFDRMPRPMGHYLVRAREHLERLEDPEYTHELLRAERIKAAYEYGRVLEIMALGYEAESSEPMSA